MGGGGGVRAMGGDLTAKSIPSAGGLIKYLCSGTLGCLLFYGRETGSKFQLGYTASSIIFGKGMKFGVKCSTITLFVCIVTFYTAMMM